MLTYHMFTVAQHRVAVWIGSRGRDQERPAAEAAQRVLADETVRFKPQATTRESFFFSRDFLSCVAQHTGNVSAYPAKRLTHTSWVGLPELRDDKPLIRTFTLTWPVLLNVKSKRKIYLQAFSFSLCDEIHIYSSYNHLQEKSIVGTVLRQRWPVLPRRCVCLHSRYRIPDQQTVLSRDRLSWFPVLPRWDAWTVRRLSGCPL